MLDVSTINPQLLPSVFLEQRSQLPTTPCIYFVINSQGLVQYIGRAIHLKRRWAQHHHQERLSFQQNVRIAYLEITDVDLLPVLENMAIYRFKPPLNGRGPISKSRNVTSSTQVHRHITQTIDVPDLAKRIQQAQIASGLNVSEVCHRIGISQTYWDKLINNKILEGLSEPTLRKIEQVLGIDLGVNFDN